MVEPTVGAAVLSAAARVGLSKVLTDAFDKGRYRVLSVVRAKLYMEEARRDAVVGLQENLKSEVKVWGGLCWEADKCPVVALGKGDILEQADVEALAASSISINHQAILDIGSEELRGRKGFSFIVMSKLEESPVLTDPEDAEGFLRENARDCLNHHFQLEHNKSMPIRKYITDLTCVPQEGLITNEVAEAIMSVAADRQYKFKQSTRMISEQKEQLEPKDDEKHWKDLEQDQAVRLTRLEFDSRMETLIQSLKRRQLPVVKGSKPHDSPARSRKLDKDLNLDSRDKPLTTALANAASEQGINITSEGISRVIQSEIAVSGGELLGPVRLCMAREDGAWQFNGLLSKPDMERLNSVSRRFKHDAKHKWRGYPLTEEKPVAIACAIASCLSSSFLLTYEDRRDLKKFARRHLVVGTSGSLEVLVETKTNGSFIYLNMGIEHDVERSESEEDILADFTDQSYECTVGYGMTRSWCAISKATAGGRIALGSVGRYLDKAKRQDLASFLKGIASGKLTRLQRDEACKELYLDVESGTRSTQCDWLDDLLRNWAASKRSTRIRVALTLKREEVASALGLIAEAKAPETDWKVISSRMRKIKALLTRKVRKNMCIGERGHIIALRNSFKEREFSTVNRFRRYVKWNFVVHVSGKNVVVVEKRGDSRMATWLPCQPEGFEAKYTPNRLGELSDKAALALVVFGWRQNMIDDVEYDDLIHAENGDANLELALTEIVKLGTELFDCSTDLARKVIEIGNEKIMLRKNDIDMLRRFIMVTAYAEGVGIVKRDAGWIKLVRAVKPRSGGVTFQIDYNMPSVMLHGDAEWVVAGDFAYQTRPATTGANVQKRTSNFRFGKFAFHEKDGNGETSVERKVDMTNVKDAGLLRESLWPGGLVLR